MHIFLVVFYILLRHLKKRFKSRQDPAQEPLGANMCDFAGELGLPKPSQNPVFCGSKTHFILKCPKPQNLMRVLHLDHILLLQNLPKTLPKSLKIRCQELSNLRQFFSTSKNRPRRLPESLLDRIFRKNVKFWAPTWPQDGTKMASFSDIFLNFCREWSQELPSSVSK